MTKSKLSLILSLVFSSVLVVGIITFAILQTSTKPSLPNPDTIRIYNKTLSATKTISKGSNEYNEIMKLYNSMFEKTYLAQLADNEILKGNITEDLYKEEWSDNNKTTGLYLEFEYTNTKKFIIYRGENSRRVDVKKVIMQITGEDKINKTHIYYTVETSTSSSSDKNKTETKMPCHPLIVEANTYNMNKYLKSIL